MQRITAVEAAEHTRQRTGVVVPVYLPGAMDRTVAVALLEDTVAALLRELGDPARLCLAADGGAGVEEARRLAGTHGLALHQGLVNRGKLAAARAGMDLLLRRTELEYFAVVDQDGDHFANELPNLVRAALSGRTHPDGEILVIGRRLSRHRPMGFPRGEIEELADRVLLDALTYHAARTGRPLDLAGIFAFEEFPDFHSGFKLFTRAAAEAVFRSEPKLAGLPEDAYYRHACEAVMSVEALLAGARLLSVQRSTVNCQPVSAFGALELARLAADKILWPCLRLEIPEPFVRQWLAQHAPRLLLHTLAPGGREELAAICRAVLAGLGARADDWEPWEPSFL